MSAAPPVRLPRSSPRSGPGPGALRRLEEPGGVPLAVWILLAGIGANLLNGASGHLGLPLSPDRVLIPLALLLMACDGRRQVLLRPGRMHLLIGLVVAWALASMAWYGNMADQVAFFAFLDRLLLPFVLYLSAPWFFATKRHRDLLLGLLTAIALYLGVTAVLEMYAPALVFPRYIVDPAAGLQFGRARGPFVAAEAMGMACVTCGFAAVLQARRARGGWQWLAAFAAGVAFVGVALTMTRSTWVGAAAGLAAAPLVSPWLRRWIPAGVGAVGLAGTAVVLAIPQIGDAVVRRFEAAESVYDRLGSNDAAMSLLADRPFTGIGWRRFYPDGSEWFRQSDAYPMNNVVIEIHNVLLSRAAELGVPAALALLAIWLLGPVRTMLRPVRGDLEGWRLLTAATFTAWVVTGFFGPLALPFPSYVVWLIAGVAGQRDLGRPSPPRSPGPAPTGNP